MAAAAAVTTTLKLAPLVLDTDYRHPVVVARELASIDLLSEGRVELGLGAGWKRKDYDSSGIPMDPPKVHVDRMIEHMQVLKGLFADGPFSFSGEHYTIAELDGTPKPYRGGGPPFVIGGGAPRVLRFAGANADIVGVIASIHSGAVDVAAAQDTLPERMDKKFAWVREGADTVSADRFDALEFNAYLSLAAVTETGGELAESLAPSFDTDPASVLASPAVLIGAPSEIVERLHERRERWGFSYTIIPPGEAHNFAPIVADLTGK